MEEKLRGILFIISGPSGVGKGTVIRHLKKIYPQFEYPISHTTRKIRPGEKDGEVYHFISREEFEDKIENGEFLEWAQVHGRDYYGTWKETIINALKEGKVVVREVDVQGAQSIQQVLRPENLVTIFLKAEDKEALIERIAKRGELPQDEVERRMKSAQREMDLSDDFDYQVWSLRDQIPKCVGDVRKIVEDELEKAGLHV